MTRQDLKQIAVDMVARIGLINLSRSALCEQAGIPIGSFQHVMGCTFSEFIGELRNDGVMSPMQPVNKARTLPELRRENILDTAVAVAERDGVDRLTRREVAHAAGISEALVTRYFPRMDTLRDEIMAQAVRHENLIILAQGLAGKSDIARNAPHELKQRAALAIAGV